MFIILTTVYLIIGNIYSNQEELVSSIRLCIMTGFMHALSAILVDFHKNLFIAFGERSVTLVFSIVAIGGIVLLGWLIGFYFGLGFWGANVGILMGEVLWILEYLIYFNYSKGFESYWRNMKTDSSLDGIVKAEAQKENEEAGKAIFEEIEEAHA